MNQPLSEPPQAREQLVLDLRSASFGYAGRAVVSGVDLAVRRGESLALLGPNGCGKSTLVKGLLGLNDHLGGDVRLFGEPLARLRRRSRIGYVPQRHTLSASVVATVGEIVSVGRLPHRKLWQPQGTRDRAAIARALDIVGLHGFERTDVTHLSGGQQRRVLVARALAAEPEVLVMDEPTAGVDETNQRVLAEAMHRLATEGVALLTVTHELEALAPAIDRVVAMSAGRIVADGTPEAVLGPDARDDVHLHDVGHAHHVDPAVAGAVRLNHPTFGRRHA